MRSMICGNDINRPIAKTFLDRLHILPCPKRGIHFGIGIIAPDHFFRDGKVMWAGFGRDFEPARLGFAYHSDRSLRTVMRQMEPTPGRFGEGAMPGTPTAF